MLPDITVKSIEIEPNATITFKPIIKKIPVRRKPDYCYFLPGKGTYIPVVPFFMPMN
jgi:hypothetical protein